MPIKILLEDGLSLTLTKYGQYTDLNAAKCIIFPKGKTTWEGFQRPFKDGDVVISVHNDVHLLRTKDSSYCAFRERWNNKFDPSTTTSVKVVRLATEEEKQKLFDAIRANGYKWNPETKALEKLIVPKFKVGDKVKLKGGDQSGIITQVSDCFYTINCKNHTHYWGIAKQDDWELVPNKFDITTLKPFDKVLVRQNVYGKWEIDFFGYYNKGDHHTTGSCIYKQCIPYESNEHLLGTTDDCDDYFKTWE